ncbi:MAG TPA: hypothetical protein VJN18_28265 [Polyangiaceae bacterium]|nr:hypothetical protein [Polyangiaceae bacterium]
MRYLGVLAGLTVASVFFACGGDGNGNGGGPGTTAGAGGEDSTPSEGGSSNTGATASMGGDPGPVDPGPTAGAGGEPPLGPASMGTPRNGVGQVVDGVVARSENFTMILSVGEEPGGNVSMISSQYRINLGVVGSTQK